MISYVGAVDDIFKTFLAKWDLEAAQIVGYTPTIYWQGVEASDLPPKDKYWIRVNQQTVMEQQATLRNGFFSRCFNSSGFVLIQIFCPKSDSLGLAKGRLLATVARNCFRGKSISGNVVFYNARINELTAETSWFRLNVVSDYEYSENF